MRLLGSGGFARVWLATQTSLDRQVALKLLNPEALHSSEQVDRFLQEAQITASIEHPNVVVLIDHGYEDGIPWIAYEYVEGRSLADILFEGPLRWEEAFDLGVQVASALDAAHQVGVLHRDVKPANVLRASHGHYKVADFGIAKCSVPSTRTCPDQVLGTPAYLAPEVIRGQPPTPQVDVYALGAMIYEAIVGDPPFDDPNPTRVLTMQLEEPVRPPRSHLESLPQRVDRVLLKALAKSPAERFLSAAALRDAFSEALASSSVCSVAAGATAAVRTVAPARTTAHEVRSLRPPAHAAPAHALQGRGAAGDATAATHKRRRTRRRSDVLALVLVVVLGAAAALLWPLRPHEAPRPVPSKPSPSASPSAVPVDLRDLDDRLDDVIEQLKVHVWNRMHLIPDFTNRPLDARLKLARDMEDRLDLIEKRLASIRDDAKRRLEQAKPSEEEAVLLARLEGLRFQAWSEHTRVTQLRMRIDPKSARPPLPDEDAVVYQVQLFAGLEYGPQGLPLLRDHLAHFARALRSLAKRLPGTRATLLKILDTDVRVAKCFAITGPQRSQVEAYGSVIAHFREQLGRQETPLGSDIASVIDALWAWRGPGQKAAPAPNLGALVRTLERCLPGPAADYAVIHSELHDPTKRDNEPRQ